MFKKILFPLLLLATTQQIFSMELDYEPLFFACEQDYLDLVKNIIENTANIDINAKDNEGRTPLLCAAYKGRWNIIHYLLMSKADKTIRDNYGQSLFSKMVYCISNSYHEFYKSLVFYTFDEIAQECTTMPLPQQPLDHQQTRSLLPHTLNVLAGIKNINSITNCGYTAIYLACINNQIPTIIELLKRGARLKQKNDFGDSAYDRLLNHEKKSLFVIREAFNNGPIKPAALLLHMFSDDQQAPLTANLLPDLTNLIKNIYTNHCLVSDQERNAEKVIWNPVCVRACKLAKINETDKNRCLTHIMMLPQHKKTEINLLLLKKGK